MIEKRELYQGPLDGQLIKSAKPEIRVLIRKGKTVIVDLVAIYAYNKERGGYCYTGTYEPHELNKVNIKEVLMLNITPVNFGIFYTAKPQNVGYKVYRWSTLEEVE